MPTTLEQEQEAAPALGLESKLVNPVINSDNIKEMAAKFKALRAEEPKPAAIAPAPVPVPDPAKPAPAPEAPKPEEEPVIDTSKMSASARANFERLEQSRKETKRQLDEGRQALEQTLKRQKELEEEVGKFKSLGVDPNEYGKLKEERERLARENEEAIKLVEAVNFERSPKFTAWWKEETKKVIARAQQKVPADKRIEIEKLLMEPPSSARDTALDELAEGLGSTAKLGLQRALDAMDDLKAQRQEALEKASENGKQLFAHEQAEAAKAQKARQMKLDTLAHKALLHADAFAAFQPDPNDPSHTAEIPQRKAFVEAFMRGQVEEDVAVSIPAAAIEGLHYKNKVVPALRAELAKAHEMIKQLQGPSALKQGGAAPAAKPADSGVKPGDSFQAAVMAAMRK